MIIRFPTGQYQDAGQLPKNPSDTANVTFTISNDDPLRSTDVILQLPLVEEQHKRAPPTYSDQVRRTAMGELVFTVVMANRNNVGSNRRQFNIGQYLEFSDEETIPVSQPSIPLTVDLQHNTSQFDLTDSGLTDEEIAEITLQSTTRKKALESQLAQVQAQIQSDQMAIGENQKSINEIRRTIAAVQLILVPTDPVMIKLVTREEILVAERDVLINGLNALNDEALQIYNDLVAISSLVK